MKNISTNGKQKLTSYRRLALVTWRNPRNPSIFVRHDMRIEAAEAFMAKWSGSEPVSLTHYVAKILGDCMARNDLLNNVLLRGRLYKRKHTGVFITTLLRTPHGKDLAGFGIPDITALSLSDVAERTRCEVDALRLSDASHALARGQRALRRVPMVLLHPLYRMIEFLQYTLNLSLTWLGVPRDPYGSVFLTNIGALGVEDAFIPLSPYARTAMLVAVGKPRTMPVVDAGKIVPGRVITITLTIDHRYADGADCAVFLRRMKKIFEHPERYPAVFSGASPSESE